MSHFISCFLRRGQVPYTVILLVLMRFLASADEMPEDGTCSSEGGETNPCLLQNRFSKYHPFIEIPPKPGPGLKVNNVSFGVSFFTIENKKEGFQGSAEMVLTMMHQIEERCQNFQAHNLYLGRTVRGLNDYFTLFKMKLQSLANATVRQTHAPLTQDDRKKEAGAKIKVKDKGFVSMDNMDKIMQNAINSQSSSEDECHAKIAQAKKALSNLQSLLNEIMTQINTTEISVILYDKELREKLKQLIGLQEWKRLGLDKCEKQKEKDENMAITLNAQLVEMREEAKDPGTQEKLSLVQQALRAMPEYSPSGEDRDSITVDVNNIPGLVQATHQAASHLAKCQKRVSLLASQAERDEVSNEDHEVHLLGLLASEDEYEDAHQDTISGKRTQDANRKGSQEPKKKSEIREAIRKGDWIKKCAEEKRNLEKMYTKAYMELNRLKAMFENFAMSGACEDSVNREYENKALPLQKMLEQIAEQSKEAQETLKELRPQLQDAINTKELLEKQIAELTEHAATLAQTLPDLNKVRDVIDALATCPGIDKLDFKMPKWTGTWVSFLQDASVQLDEEQDKAMTWACNKVIAGSRAAEHREIEQRTVSDIPIYNDAGVALMGVCPGCAGETDESLKSRHARTCWKPNAPLNDKGVSNTCGKGKKVILCVLDQMDK